MSGEGRKVQPVADFSRSPSAQPVPTVRVDTASRPFGALTEVFADAREWQDPAARSHYLMAVAWWNEHDDAKAREEIKSGGQAESQASQARDASLRGNSTASIQPVYLPPPQSPNDVSQAIFDRVIELVEMPAFYAAEAVYRATPVDRVMTPEVFKDQVFDLPTQMAKDVLANQFLVVLLCQLCLTEGADPKGLSAGLLTAICDVVNSTKNTTMEQYQDDMHARLFGAVINHTARELGGPVAALGTGIHPLPELSKAVRGLIDGNVPWPQRLWEKSPQSYRHVPKNLMPKVECHSFPTKAAFAKKKNR